MQAAGHRPDRSGGREPLPVPRDGGARRAVRRGDREHRHRRAVDDPLGGEEPRARRGGRRSRRLRGACSRRSTHGGEVSTPTALPAGAQGVRAHGRLRRRDRVATSAGSTAPDARAAPTSPRRCTLGGALARELRYGENPHQKAAFYALDAARPAARRWRAREVLQGKELSYNNLLDLDAALRIWRRVRARRRRRSSSTPTRAARPISTRACADAYRRARETDPVSAFGGIVAVNRAVDGELARELERDVPRVRDRARRSSRTALRGARGEEEPAPARPTTIAARRAPGALELRSVAGGFLVQTRDIATSSRPRRRRSSTKRAPTRGRAGALDFAWRVVQARQVERDRVRARGGAHRWASAPARCRASTRCGSRCKARAPLAGAVRRVGRVLPVPRRRRRGGRRRAPPPSSSRAARCATTRSIAAADEHGMAMVFTGERHFRH